MAITNIKNIEITNCIIDELHVRSKTDASVDLTSAKNAWQIDTYLLAKFMNSLEAGNVANGGLTITKFNIKRRKTTDVIPLTLGSVNFVSGQTMVYTDYTQANDTYIYSAVPVGQNGIEGAPSEVSASSDFTGWYLVDKDTNNALAFNQFIGNDPMVNTQLNQGRTVIETFSQFPQVFYNSKQYHTFSLTAVIIPSALSKSGKSYTDIINNFISSHKVFIVKASNGRIFVGDISNPRFSTPMNTWTNYDYGIITLDFMELQSYDDFMNGM